MPLSEKTSFISARPIWESGCEREKNLTLRFKSEIPAGKGTALRIAAHSRYQIFVNRRFLAAGPARAAHGFYRVDEYQIDDRLTEASNSIEILVAGYNINSYYLLDRPSFVCAEITRGDAVLCATGVSGFFATRYTERRSRVLRYSFQRTFTESYDLAKTDETPITISETEPKCFIKRGSPYCRYESIYAGHVIAKGSATPTGDHPIFEKSVITNINDVQKGFLRAELEENLPEELLAYNFTATNKTVRTPVERLITAGDFAVYDMTVNTSGYISIALTADADTDIYVTFDERFGESGFIGAYNNGCVSAVKWHLSGGRRYELLSFEPYTYRYLQIFTTASDVKVESVSQIRECYDESLLCGKRHMPTRALQKVYDAAVESFVQNTTDIYMDCPSRERAGWLCDSFFTSRVEKSLTGKSAVEHDFLENFLLPDHFDSLPDGMLPMCYPSDHPNGIYIPNWAMWFVLELREYLARSGDRALVDAARERVYNLIRFFEKYENSDGLLSRLDSWVFVEWSQANKFVQDINYPSNMLYAMMLDSAAELYSDAHLHAKAELIRATVREVAFDGEFFRDNSVYDENGIPRLTENRTETCQYYAFFTGTATPESHPALYDTLMRDFGPSRADSGKYPEIYPSNAFVGNYLRLELLFRDRRYDEMTDEILAFFLPMAEATGTLWENMTDHASCNHGFASHVIYWLNEIFK